MTDEQFINFKNQIEKEKNDYTKFNLAKSKASIFDNCREIFTTLYLYDYLLEKGQDLNYHKFPKENILKSIYEFMNSTNSEVSENNIEEILDCYNGNYVSDYLIKGKLFRPIFYGEEECWWGNIESDEDTCPDCGCHVGEQHLPNCDIERCPCCQGQMLSCSCGTKVSVDEKDKAFLPMLIKEQEKDNKELNELMEEWLKQHRKKDDNQM